MISLRNLYISRFNCIHVTFYVYGYTYCWCYTKWTNLWLNNLKEKNTTNWLNFGGTNEMKHSDVSKLKSKGNMIMVMVLNSIVLLIKQHFRRCWRSLPNISELIIPQKIFFSYMKLPLINELFNTLPRNMNYKLNRFIVLCLFFLLHSYDFLARFMKSWHLIG